MKPLMATRALLELHWVDIYRSAELREKVALSMELMGLEQIKGAYIYQHFNDVVTAVKDMTVNEWSQERKNQFSLPFIQTQLNDDLRIICFFENYFKAALIRAGYVIHGFRKSTNHGWAKVMNNRRDNYLVDVDILRRKRITNDMIDEMCISFSKLLTKRRYSAFLRGALSIDTPTMTAIHKINRRRNLVHLYAIGRHIQNPSQQLELYQVLKVAQDLMLRYEEYGTPTYYLFPTDPNPKDG